MAIQRNSNKETQVSLRDADFEPVEDASIDVFSAQYDDDAFDADDGECDLRFVRDETPSFDTCAIDTGDQPTDGEGNVEFTLFSDVDPVVATCSVGTGNLDFITDTGSEDRQFWAWTGENGDKVSEDTKLQELEDVDRPVGMGAPDYALVSGGLPSNDELAKMGETVEFTLQLKDQTGSKRNHDNDADARPDRSGNWYTLRIEKYFLMRVPGSDSDADDSITTPGSANAAFPNVPGDWMWFNPANPTSTSTTAAQARFQTPYDTAVQLSADGSYTITLRNDDLNAAGDDPDVGVKFTLRPLTTGNDLLRANLVRDIDVLRPGTKGGTNYAVSSTSDGPPASTVGHDTVTGHVIFSDDKSDPHDISAAGLSRSAEESRFYRIISGSRTGNSFTVQVVDQYGDPMGNVEFWLNSDLDGVGDLNRDGLIGAGESLDEVVYPEEVDRTVQASEDGYREDNSEAADAKGPAELDILDDPDDASPGETDTDDTPSLVWIRRTPPASHINPDNRSQRITFSGSTTPTKSDVDRFFQDVSHPYWVVMSGNEGIADDYVVRREQVAGPFDTVVNSFRPLRTRSNGTYRVGYSYIGTDAKTETVVPSVIRIERRGDNPETPDADGNPDNGYQPLTDISLLTHIIKALGSNPSTGPESIIETNHLLGVTQQEEIGDPLTVYWAKEGNSSQSDTIRGGGPEPVKLLVRHWGNRALLVNERLLGEASDTDNPMVYYYDEDDNFSIEGVGVTFEMFEEALKKSFRNGDNVQATSVEWRNYTTSRPGRINRTIWELKLTCS